MSELRARKELTWIEWKIGSTARERLKWFLEDFLRADLEAATDHEWAWWMTLLDGFIISGEGPWTMPPLPGQRGLWLPLHDPAKEVLGLVREYRLQFTTKGVNIKPEVGPTITDWTATNDEKEDIRACQKLLREKLQRLILGGPCQIELERVRLWCNLGPGSRLNRIFIGTFFTRVAVSLFQHIDSVGSNRLGLCQLKEDGAATPCGKIFLISKRQRYCSPAHSRRAMYLRWKGRKLEKTKVPKRRRIILD